MKKPAPKFKIGDRVLISGRFRGRIHMRGNYSDFLGAHEYKVATGSGRVATYSERSLTPDRGTAPKTRTNPGTGANWKPRDVAARIARLHKAGYRVTIGRPYQKYAGKGGTKQVDITLTHPHQGGITSTVELWNARAQGEALTRMLNSLRSGAKQRSRQIDSVADFHRTRAKRTNPARGGEVDTHAATDLMLCMENNWPQLIRGQLFSIQKNLLRKLPRGNTTTPGL